MNNETMKTMQKLASAMLDYAELDPSTKTESLELLNQMLEEKGLALCPCGLIFERSKYTTACGTCEEEWAQQCEAKESAFLIWQSEQH